jgi:trimethylamine--corrinoid protein Co-methyltransferase
MNGVPIKVSTAPQAGATAPASIAGTLALSNAEVLSGFVALNLLKPGCHLFYGNWSFIYDLRTGAFVGGGGEMGLLASGCAQLSRFYDFASSIVAGMSSAKIPDVQYGWEKGYLTALASQAGANMVTMAMGGLADNIAYSPEALVIDESLISGVLRCLKGIEVNEKTLGLESIMRSISGSGHFLDDEMTLGNMKSEFIYPEFADRLSIDPWIEEGRPDLRDKARLKVQSILSSHYPDHIGSENDARIRQALNIQLPKELMHP